METVVVFNQNYLVPSINKIENLGLKKISAQYYYIFKRAKVRIGKNKEYLEIGPITVAKKHNPVLYTLVTEYNNNNTI